MKPFQNPTFWLYLGLPLALAAFPPLDWRWALAPALAAMAFWLAHAAPFRLWADGGLLWGWWAGYLVYQLGWVAQALAQKAGRGWPKGLAFTLLLCLAVALVYALPLLAARWLVHRRGWPAAPAMGAGLGLAVWLVERFPLGGLPWGEPPAPLAGGWLARYAVPLLGGPGLAALLGLAAALAVAPAARQRLPHRLDGWGPLGLGLPLLAGLAFALPAPASPPAGPPASPSAKPVWVLLVGDNLPLALLADPAQAPLLFDRFLSRSTASLQAPPFGKEGANRLVVWPESAVAGHLEQSPLAARLMAASSAQRARFLVGSGGTSPQGRPVNAAFLADGEGLIRYDKRRLVAFGEYVPAGFGWLFGKKATAGQQDYAAGSRPPWMEWEGGRLGLAICLESTLPGHVAQMARQGADFGAVLSNDRWLPPSAQRHHLQLTQLRGLENGLDLLVAANGGYSAHVSQGRVVALAAPGQPPLWASPHPPVPAPYLLWRQAPFWLFTCLLLLGGWAAARPGLMPGLMPRPHAHRPRQRPTPK